MPDSAAVATEQHQHGRRTLALLTVPIVVLIVASNVGTALAPELVDKHPLVLLALNAQNRHLALTTNQLDTWSYYLVGTARLLVGDPIFFLLGHWYGDRAMVWMERRTKTLGNTLRQLEAGFKKAVYPVVFVAPNQWVCLFAGAAGMSVVGFFATNLVGTLARLYLIRRLGETFEEPLDDVLGWIGDHRGPLLVVTIGLAVVFLIGELRGGGAGLEELEELADEDAGIDADEPAEGRDPG